MRPWCWRGAGNAAILASSLAEVTRQVRDLQSDTPATCAGNTPFNDAVRSKHDNVVSVFKKNDPNLTFKLAGNELGVLMCQAANEGRLDDIKRLVVNGVDANESDYDGRTALHLAASEGNMEVLKYLVRCVFECGSACVCARARLRFPRSRSSS